jgi:hypothetical protein
MDQVLLQLIAAIVTLGGAWLAIQAKRGEAQGKLNETAIQGVHLLINSQLAQWKAELVAHTDAAIAAAYAKGIAHGESAERDRTAALLAGVRADTALAAAHTDLAANSAATAANTVAVGLNTEGRAP